MEGFRWLPVVLALTLTACGGTTSNLKQGVKEDFEFTAGGQDGLVVFSTRFSTTGCAGNVPGSGAHMMIFHENSRKSEGPVFLKSPILKPDVENPLVHVFVKKLRSGRYVFDRFGYAWGYLPGQGHDSNKPLGLSFIVSPGKIYYLGEISIAMKSCEDFDIQVSDQRQRDLAVFASRMQKIPASWVRPQLMSVRASK